MAEMCIDLLSYGLIDSYALRTMGGGVFNFKIQGGIFFI